MSILRMLSALVLVAGLAPACSTTPDDTPLVGVTLLNKQDVFYQELEAGSGQRPSSRAWSCWSSRRSSSCGGVAGAGVVLV